jgi:hypothetical protein
MKTTPTWRRRLKPTIVIRLRSVDQSVGDSDDRHWNANYAAPTDEGWFRYRLQQQQQARGQSSGPAADA